MFAEENDLELKPEDAVVAQSDDLTEDIIPDSEELPANAGEEETVDTEEPGTDTESEPAVEPLPE